MFLRLLRLQTDTALMLLDAGAVMAQRLDDLADPTPAGLGERVRMVTEKQTAFAVASFEATNKILHCAHPVVVWEAALSPLSRTARANRDRLHGRSESMGQPRQTRSFPHALTSDT